MGRRRKNQDSTQVANADQTVVSQDNQLNVTPTPVQTIIQQEEPKSVAAPVEEIPYDDRPIPEAYFPPEDETTQEFIPEPHIQQTVQPATYRVISKRALEALKFDIKPVEKKETETKLTETKPEVKTTPVSTKSIDWTALQFEIKQTEVKPTEASQAEVKQTEAKPTENLQTEVKQTEQKTEAKAPYVYSNNKTDFTALQFDTKDFYLKKDTSKSNAEYIVKTPLAVDSLTAKNDTISADSLAKDSVALLPVAKPEPKREIVAIDGKTIPDTINNTWWYTPLLLVIFIALIIILRDRKKAIFSELEAFIKPNTDGSIFGFQWLQNSKYKFVLSGLGMILLSLYLFLANQTSISTIWIFFVAVIGYVITKKIMLALLEYIYFEGANVTSMSSAFMVMIRQMGLMLIPAVLGLSFAPESYQSFFTYFGIIVISIAIFAFNFKLILNFFRGITSIFYLILYLCTLEVIPVAIFFVLGLSPRL